MGTIFYRRLQINFEIKGYKQMLRIEILKRGYTIKSFAKKIGLPVWVLRMKLNGYWPFNTEEIEAIKQVLKLDYLQVIRMFFGGV